MAQCILLDTDGFVIPSLGIEDRNGTTTNTPQVEDLKHPTEVSKQFPKCYVFFEALSVSGNFDQSMVKRVDLGYTTG